MIDIKNISTIDKALQYAKDKMLNFFNTQEYSTAYDRYQKRRKLFLCIHDVDIPLYKSRLYLPTYRAAMQALIAQFKAAYATNPLVFVKPSSGSATPEEKQVALMAHYEINDQLEKTKWKTRKLFHQFRYVAQFGVAIGREVIKSTIVKRGGKEQREQITMTDIINPLNFAHEINQDDFPSSQWGGVRFEISISDLYKWRQQGRGYKPGLDYVIEQLENNTGGILDVSKTTYYTERASSVNSYKDDTVVVWEYCGPLRIEGNKFDDEKYLILWCPQFEKYPVYIEKSPFGLRLPYWKMATELEPDGPYPIDPCAALGPINIWQNTTINGMNDYSQTTLKAMYEVIPSNIVGGLLALNMGLPNGFLPLANGVQLNNTIAPIPVGKQSLPPVSEIMNWISSFKQEFGPSSNLRGKQGNSNADTATGISLLAQREDTMIESMMDQIDAGVTDCAEMKMWLTTEMGFTPKKGVIQEKGSAPVEVNYIPSELNTVDLAYSVKREQGMIRAGKYMSFIKFITQMDQTFQAKGINLNGGFILDMVQELGMSYGVEDVDKYFNEARQLIRQQTPEIQTGQPGQPPQPGAGAPAGQQVSGSEAVPQPAQEVAQMANQAISGDVQAYAAV